MNGSARKALNQRAQASRPRKFEVVRNDQELGVGVQVIFCNPCLILNLREANGDFEKIRRPNPAVTYQVVLENNLPVAIPVCLGHVAFAERSELAFPDGS